MKHSPEDVENAVDFLKDKATYGSSRTVLITYTELFNAIDLPLPENIYAEGDSGFANRFMEAVLLHCRSNGLPPLDAMVILKTDGQPSRGYFAAWSQWEPLAKSDPTAFWLRQLQECRDWGEAEKRRRRNRT